MFRIVFATALAVCALASPCLAGPSKASRHHVGAHVEHQKKVARHHGKSRRTGGADAVQIAQRFVGTNPTKMRKLWCANFVGMIERKAGRSGTGSNLARSYASYGHRVAKPMPGDIAVMHRGKNGGHVGYFVEWAPNGKAVVISGNSRGGKVSKGQYSANRIVAWRRPA